MEPTQPTLRRCTLCKSIKQPLAFVGEREVCRACWLDLSSNDRSRYILNATAIANRRALKAKKATSSLSNQNFREA